MQTPLPILPWDIVHYIHTLLNARDAARMATVAKTLYAAWSTRKNLEFDELHFRRAATFWNIALRTLQRFHATGLQIDTFTIRIFSYGGSLPALEDILGLAAKLGALNITIELRPTAWVLYVPSDVFTSGRLLNLSVIGGIYVIGKLDVSRPVTLQSLHFTPDGAHASTKEEFMREFVWRIPTLKKLVCWGGLLSFDKNLVGYGGHCLESLTLEDLHSKDAFFFAELTRLFPRLKHLCVRGLYNCGDIRIYSQSLERITIDANAQYVDAVFNVPNLRSFCLSGAAESVLKFEDSNTDWVSDVRIPCYNSHPSWFRALKNLLESLSGSKILNLVINVVNEYRNFAWKDNIAGTTPEVERLLIKFDFSCLGLEDGLRKICRPKLVSWQGR